MCIKIHLCQQVWTAWFSQSKFSSVWTHLHSHAVSICNWIPRRQGNKNGGPRLWIARWLSISLINLCSVEIHTCFYPVVLPCVISCMTNCMFLTLEVLCFQMLGLCLPDYWSLQGHALGIETLKGITLENWDLGTSGLWAFVILVCLFQFLIYKLESWFGFFFLPTL